MLTCDINDSPASLSVYKYLFYLGQLLHGAGASSLYILGVTYLDENLPLRSSSILVSGGHCAQLILSHDVNLIIYLYRSFKSFL